MTENLLPPSSRLSSLKTLMNTKDSYKCTKEYDQLFIDAMKEVLHWHKENCDFYRQYLENENFQVESIQTVEDCYKIPFLHANFFKRNEIISIPKKDVFLHLTSSGTTGQHSQMFFDEWTIKSARNLVNFIYERRNWISDKPTNYILLSYEPTSDSKLGTSNTNVFLTQFAPAKELFFALRLNGKGGHDFDVYGVIEKLKKFAKDDAPVRILGFPAFMYFILEKIQLLGLGPIKLPKGSIALFGGGWKGHADKAIPKLELYDMIKNILGIEDHNIGESYGSVEHSIPYVECPHHNLHIPIYSRAIVRDVKTLEPLPYGKAGFINFISPYITSVAANSVMMGDLAEIYPPDACGCGYETPFFKILGRAGISKNKSCAVAASELLK